MENKNMNNENMNNKNMNNKNLNNKNLNNELDELIRASIKLEDVPSKELNNHLKANLYQQEANMKRNKNIRSVSLWYVPMILNFLTFSLFAVFALFMIANPYLSVITAFVCGYISIAGVIITAVGVKRTNIKEEICLHIEKRGAFV